MNKKYRKILAGISAIVMCSILAAGCVNNIEREPENNSKVDDEIIAEINGEDVKQSEIQELLNYISAVYNITEESENWEEIKNSTIKAYINEKVCELKAAEMGIVVTDDELQSELNYTITQYGGEKSYEEYITSLHISKDFIEKQIRGKLLSAKLFEEVTKDITVKDDEVKAYFEEHLEDFIAKETRDVYGIAFDSKEEAESVLTELLAGNLDFRKVANEKSLDNKNGDGFLGTVSPGDLVEQFDTVVFSLNSNQYADSVLPLDIELEDGGYKKYYYIIKAINFVPEKIKSYEEVKEDLTKNILRDKKQEKFNDEFSKWKTEYNLTQFSPQN